MTHTLEKYVKIFPSILFLCPDDEHSMHFILSVKYLSDAQQEELVELLHQSCVLSSHVILMENNSNVIYCLFVNGYYRNLHCGAKVSFSVDDATNHSAVIVDHDEVVSVKIPAFTLKYIEECLSKLKVQDISNYRQDATSHIASNVQCMDVVYYRIQSWDSVLTKEEKQWLGSCKQKDGLKPEEEVPKTIDGCRVLSSDEDSKSDSDVEQNDNLVHVDKTRDKVKNTNTKMEKSQIPKGAKESTNSFSKALNSKSKNGTAKHSGNNQTISSGSRGINTTASTSAQTKKKWLGSCKQKDGLKPEEEVPKTIDGCRVLSSDEDSKSDSDVEQNDNLVHVDKTRDKVKNTNTKMEKSQIPKGAKESTNSFSKALNSKSKNGTAKHSGNNQTISSGSRGINTTASTSAQTKKKWLGSCKQKDGLKPEEEVPKTIDGCRVLSSDEDSKSDSDVEQNDNLVHVDKTRDKVKNTNTKMEKSQIPKGAKESTNSFSKALNSKSKNGTAKHSGNNQTISSGSRGINTTASTSAQTKKKWLGSCKQKDGLKPEEEVPKTIDGCRVLSSDEDSKSDSDVEQNDNLVHVDKTRDKVKNTNTKMEKSQIPKGAKESTNSFSKALNSKSKNGTAKHSGNNQTISSGSRGINTTASTSAQTKKKWLGSCKQKDGLKPEEEVPKTIDGCRVLSSDEDSKSDSDVEQNDNLVHVDKTRDKVKNTNTKMEKSQIPKGAKESTNSFSKALNSKSKNGTAKHSGNNQTISSGSRGINTTASTSAQTKKKRLGSCKQKDGLKPEEEVPKTIDGCRVLSSDEDSKSDSDVEQNDNLVHVDKTRDKVKNTNTKMEKSQIPKGAKESTNSFSKALNSKSKNGTAKHSGNNQTISSGSRGINTTASTSAQTKKKRLGSCKQKDGLKPEEEVPKTIDGCRVLSSDEDSKSDSDVEQNDNLVHVDKTRDKVKNTNTKMEKSQIPKGAKESTNSFSKALNSKSKNGTAKHSGNNQTISSGSRGINTTASTSAQTKKKWLGSCKQKDGLKPEEEVPKTIDGCRVLSSDEDSKSDSDVEQNDNLVHVDKTRDKVKNTNTKMEKSQIPKGAKESTNSFSKALNSKSKNGTAKHSGNNQTISSGSRGINTTASTSAQTKKKRLGSCKQKDGLKPEEEVPKTIDGCRVLSSDEDSKSDSDVEQNDNLVHVDKTRDKVKNTNTKMEKSQIPKGAKESTNSFSKALNSKSKNGTAKHSGNNQTISSGSRGINTTASTSAQTKKKRLGSCKQKDGLKPEEEVPKTIDGCRVLSSDEDSKSDSDVEQNDNLVHVDKTRDKVKNTNTKMEKSQIPKGAKESTNSFSKALNSKSKNGTAKHSGNNQTISSGSRGINTTASTSAQTKKKWLGSCKQKDGLKPEEEVPKTIDGCRVLSSDEDSKSDSDVEQNDNLVHVDKTRDKVKNTNTKMEKSQIPKGAKESTNSFSKALNSKSKNGTAKHSGNNQTISSGSRGINTTASTSAQTKKKRSFLDRFQSSSSDEEDLQPKAMEKEENKNPFGFAAADEDLFKPTKDKKHSRLPYSYDEQSNILKYIVDHDEYSRVKGRNLWMIMERRKICPNRTWQSMKEHFVKKIAYNLEAFNFLSASDKMKLKQVLF